VLASSLKVVEVSIIRVHDVDFAAENETNESSNASAAESAGQAEDDLTPLVSNNSGTP